MTARGLQPTRVNFSIAHLLVWYVVFLFSTTFHEAAHSLLAYWGGDRTAYEGGQVSLDPVPHIRREPFGLVIVPILSFVLQQGQWMIGWASAPYDPDWSRREPRKYSLMSLAGPVANFLLAGLAIVSIKALVAAGVLQIAQFEFGLDHWVEAVPGKSAALSAIAMALSVLFSINIILGTFNLIPIPPLDGAAVIEGLFPNQLRRAFTTVRTTGVYQLLGMVIAWKIAPYVIIPVLHALLPVLMG